MTNKTAVRVKRAKHVIKDQGLLALFVLLFTKLQKEQQKQSVSKKAKIRFLAKYDDILKADWSANPYTPPKIIKQPPFTINWVMSPPGDGAGGGHQNIFRFIAYLARQGHTCNVYLYSDSYFQEPDAAHKVFAKAYPNTTVKFNWLKGSLGKADAVFATGWETAYPVFNDPSESYKFYFIQDFEPYFYPVGSEYILAENTYRMNLHGITAGGWLSEKLSSEYGMTCDSYNFGTDRSFYTFDNTKLRKEIFFYARPVTARRGFELGIMALQLFHEVKPDYKITLAGWDVSDYEIPFPYTNLKTLQLNELSEVYNRCAAGLVISLTNMSLLPLELLSSGVIPIVNEGPNNKKVSDNPFIKFANASPGGLAQALIETVEKEDLPTYAKRASSSVEGLDWEKSCKKLENILRSRLDG